MIITAIPITTIPKVDLNIQSLANFNKYIPGITPANNKNDSGITAFKDILLRSLQTIYAFVGMLIKRSTGVVILFDTTNENKEPITRVFPNPVLLAPVPSLSSIHPNL